MANRKAIVIGAGVGGLVAAIDLAVAGHQVTLLETQSAPGGKMRQVIAGGAAIDAGPTVFTMRWVFEEIFANAGVSFADRIVLSPARVLARHAWGTGGRLDLFADLAESADAIGVFAGAKEAAGFLEFSERARRIYETLEKPFLRAPLPTQLSLVRAAGLRKMLEIAPFETMMSALQKYFSDPRLQQLFGRYATYCGSSPYLAPATLMLVAHVERDGVWLPEGGMHALAGALAKLAAEKSVDIHYDSAVTRILIKNGRAAGIELANGEQMHADNVVVNADPAALSAGFFGPDVSKAVAALPVQNRSLSALTWAISGRVSGFPLSRHNVFFSPDYPVEFNDILRRKRLPSIPTVYVCAQDRADNEAAPPSPERFLALVNAPAVGDLTELSAGDVSQCKETAFLLMRQCGLQMDPVETITTQPKNFEKLFPATGGALYGPAVHGAMATFKRPGSRTKIPGLFLAGGSTHPGAGVPMAALSGRLAAASVLADGNSTKM